ncbi:hypothetical protein [Streptomyces sp. PTD5-9]|uniref:hypothetical protein n=1 Tax=Streptomyces sp. PTD5-9 TaxID=3120150 RepID=UPI0030085E1A
MAVTPTPTGDVFARIGRWVEGRYADERLCAHEGTCPAYRSDTCLTLEEMRSATALKTAGSPARLALWQHIARRVREASVASGVSGRDDERRWELIALWLLTPRLRGGARTVARRTGAEPADARSAMLAGALDALRTVGTVMPPDVEKYLVDAAFHAGWRTGRRDPRETPTDAWDRTPSAPDRPGGPSGPSGPGEPGCLCDPSGVCDPAGPRGPYPRRAGTASGGGCAQVVRVHTMTRSLFQRAHGERLGSLAYRLGLLPHVREARRRRRARPRHRADTGRARAAQPFLFDVSETREAGNDAAS